MGVILAIDPGNERSAYVRYDDVAGVPIDWADGVDNWALLYRLDGLEADHLTIEKFTSFGKPVGTEVFQTVFWSGRLAERWRLADDNEALMISRMDVKHFLCGTARANDSWVRQALIDRWGTKDQAIGCKASPGPLNGLYGHCWQALGLAVTAHDILHRPEQLTLAA